MMGVTRLYYYDVILALVGSRGILACAARNSIDTKVSHEYVCTVHQDSPRPQYFCTSAFLPNSLTSESRELHLNLSRNGGERFPSSAALTPPTELFSLSSAGFFTTPLMLFYVRFFVCNKACNYPAD